MPHTIEHSPEGTPTNTPDVDDSAALERLLQRRFSCRGFLPQPVAPDIIERVLALAQRTASWCNAQPWQLVVTRGEATERFRTALFDEMQHANGEASDEPPDFAWPTAYRDAYQARRRECGFGLYDAVGIAHGDRAASARQAMENFRLFGAPHVAIVTTPADLGVYGAVDCGAYVQNFMLAATSLGLGCIAQAALATRPEFIRRHFGLPAERRIVCGISFGYADPAHPANGFRTTRADWRTEVTVLDR
jgi:nitroreductase